MNLFCDEFCGFSSRFLTACFFPGIAWGDVSTRENCILSSQQVFKRLLSRSPRKMLLSFDVLALATIQPDGTMDVTKLKDMIRLLRPDRDGKLGMVDFVKSVDSVYKESRLLRASVRNSEKIDRAFEKAINIVFYVIVVIVVASQLGFDPLALFLSLSSIVLAFAFMVGEERNGGISGWPTSRNGLSRKSFAYLLISSASFFEIRSDRRLRRCSKGFSLFLFAVSFTTSCVTDFVSCSVLTQSFCFHLRRLF